MGVIFGVDCHTAMLPPVLSNIIGELGKSICLTELGEVDMQTHPENWDWTSLKDNQGLGDDTLFVGDDCDEAFYNDGDSDSD